MMKWFFFLMIGLPIFAQADVQRSSAPQGVQIYGSTDIFASQESAAVVSVGAENKSRNSAGTVSGGVQTQGNVRLNVRQKEVTAVTYGKDNTASNQAATIGGK